MSWQRRFLSRSLVTSWPGSNESEKKFHNTIKTISTAFAEFEMSAFMERLDFWRGTRAIATVNSTIRALRAVLNHAVEDELIAVVPKLKILPGANVRSWILSPEQEPKYLNACTEPLRTVATIILDAGLRPDECFRLKWENVRWIDDKRAVLIVPGTKTEAASRIVPMTPRVRAILQSRWEKVGKKLGSRLVDGFSLRRKRL